MRRKSGPKSLHISRVHEPPEREPSFAGRFSARDSSRPRSRALRLRRLARNSAASRRARSAAFLDLPSLSSGMRHLITRVAADPASARFSEDTTAFFSGVDVPEPLHALFVFRAARHEVIGASAMAFPSVSGSQGCAHPAGTRPIRQSANQNFTAGRTCRWTCHRTCHWPCRFLMVGIVSTPQSPGSGRAASACDALGQIRSSVAREVYCRDKLMKMLP